MQGSVRAPGENGGTVTVTRIDLYRLLLAPCKLDVHGQMHARPSTVCTRRNESDRNIECLRCSAITLLIHADYMWTGEKWVLSPELTELGWDWVPTNTDTRRVVTSQDVTLSNQLGIRPWDQR